MGIFLRKTQPAAGGRSPSRTFRPRLELMEDRSVPSAGALDPTFGTGGLVVTPLTGQQQIEDVAIYPAGSAHAGKIVAAGSSSDGDSKFLVVRYHANGTLDTSFGSGGIATTTFPKSSYQSIYAIGIQPDGKIVAGGTALVSGTETWALARYNTNGTLDTSFGSRGRLTFDPNPTSNTADSIKDLLIQPDGKIVAVGTNNYIPSVQTVPIVRFLAGGKVDTTFSGDGIATVAGDFTSVALQPNGNLVVAGSVPEAGTNDTELDDSAFWRFNPDGSPDNSFGNAGRVVVSLIAGFQDLTRGLAIQPDGKVVATVDVDSAVMSPIDGYHYPATVGTLRLNATGTLDQSYGTNGVTNTSLSIPNATYTSLNTGSVVLQADGKPLAAASGIARITNPDGSVTDKRFSAVVRYSQAGVPDATWANTGVALNYDATSGARRLAVQADGRVVNAGSTGGYVDVALICYLPAAPVIGSFTTNSYPVTAGSPVTLTAANVQALNPGSTITQVAFYADGNGDGVLTSADTLLGYGTQAGTGTWTFTFTFPTSGTYKLFAQAKDSYGVLSDPLALELQVQ